MMCMTYGRPREFDIDRALEAATQQFWAVGYEATSLQDLLKSMSLSKSSLYQTFGNKHELFIRCLEHYQQSMADMLREKLDNSSSVKQFVSEFLEEVIAESNHRSGRKGCFLVNTANELSQRDADIGRVVTDGTSNVAKVFQQAIELGIKKNEISAEPPVEHLVGYLMTTVSGLRTMTKAGAEQNTLKPVVDLIIKTLF
jgi:TetR/AcrR family transcriptional regulator, transcriptional repressor for nem operon